jgi:hypothetical protein
MCYPRVYIAEIWEFVYTSKEIYVSHNELGK